MEYYSAIKRSLVICKSIDGTGDHYVKWIDPGLETQDHVISLIWKSKTIDLIDIENRMEGTMGSGD